MKEIRAEKLLYHRALIVRPKSAFPNSSGLKSVYERLRFRDGLVSFSKPRRRRRRECHETKGLMSRTIAVHVRFESLYISLPPSAKQQREMTNFHVLQ